MTQISKNPLNKEIEKRVYEVLMESIASVRSHDAVSQLLDDLLSPTERLMIAKRLSIAFLLFKKYDQRTISKWLKVSLGTINKVSLAMQIGKGGYLMIIKSIISKEELKGFIEKIELTFATLLLLPKNDRRRWNQELWDKKIGDLKSKKPF